MKYLMMILAVAILGFSGCKKCKNENPRARVVNDGTESVSVQIQTSGGNTININNIEPNQVSAFENYAPGIVDFTISVGNGTGTVDYKTTVTMANCYEYDIQIDNNNIITTVPTER